MFNTITPTRAHNLLKGGTTLIAQLSWVIYLTVIKIIRMSHSDSDDSDVEKGSKIDFVNDD